MPVLPHTSRLLNQGDFRKLSSCFIKLVSSSKIANFCFPYAQHFELYMKSKHSQLLDAFLSGCTAFISRQP
uniref:Uncharacterized protein n=1 Tax=Rhizophora mucronata TaxID=61149 RepID=A0A2P2J8K8_RHIMU